MTRKIFEDKRDYKYNTGERTNLHNPELQELKSSRKIVRNFKTRRLKYAGHVTRMEQSRKAYRVLVGNPERKRYLGRPRRRTGAARP